jgi:hypothetical protein
MVWTQQFVDLALSNNALTAVIDDRLYPDILPQSNTLFPAIIYRVSNTTANNFYEAPSVMDFKTVDVTVYGRTKSEAIATAELFRQAVEGFRPAGKNLIESIKCHGGGADDYLEFLGLFTETLEYKIGAYR